jgi:hypothetical protein
MAGQTRSKSIGLILLLFTTVIFLVSRSYFPLSPAPVQLDIREAYGIHNGEALPDNQLETDLSVDFSFSPKLTQHGFEDGHGLGNEEAATANYLPDLVSSSQRLQARQAIADDYTCAVGRPCRNGACCGDSGVCGYG